MPPSGRFKVCFIYTFVAGEYEVLRQQYPKLASKSCLIEKLVIMTSWCRQ